MKYENQMAVILEKVLRGQIQPSEVIDWLLLKLPPDSTDQSHKIALHSCDSLRSTFVNYFINYLRTQTSQLSVNGQASFASPVRKPANVTQPLKHQRMSVTKTAKGSHCSKVQLFGSPASSDLSDISTLDTSFSSVDISSQFPTRTAGKEIRKEFTTSPFTSTDEDGWSSPSFDLLAKRSVGKKVNVKSRSHKSHSFVGKTTKDRNDNKRNVSAPEPSFNYSINSLQDFPSIGSTGLSTSTPRRITPTAVSTPLNISAKDASFGERSFSPWSAKLPAYKDGSSSPLGKPNLEEERDLLKKMKSSKQRSAALHTAISRSPQFEKPVNSSVCGAIPELEKVTNQEHLEIIIEVYNRLLEEHLVPNLWMEIYFLFQLLTVKGNTSDNASFTENSHLYLSTVHNAVYFAVEVLNKQKRYLAHFDKATLKQLVENETMQKFKPSLHAQLQIYCENSSSNLTQPSKFSELLGAVPFHVETDNRGNFPSDKAFHCFKKQRDKFYELLREWQVNHTSPGWSMHASMSLRIRELIGMTSDITNIFHFAKLFTSQLINMCTGDKDVENSDSSDNVFLNHLKMANPDKLKRLEERFINPSSVVGPCPLPQFRGQQEFFQKFIVEADSFLFNQYLMDCFSSRILELNKFNSYIPDLNTSDSNNLPDKDQRDQFIACVQTLQLLAKFLGFVTFWPYKQMGKLSEKLKEEITACRQKVPHQLDVLSCLQTGYCNRRLILVVPWLVEYLSMLDSSAVSMEYYNTTLKLLRTIYRTVGLSSPAEFPACNQFLLLVLIGWLFEVLSFTPDLSFSTVKEEDDITDDVTEPRLDHIPFVEQSLLYSCCPYLSDIKTLLSESTASSPMRKITPVAASTTQPEVTTAFLLSKVQSDLERNFLHSQSPSLKKTVEFVGTRVASNCIKHIDSQQLTVKRKILSELIMKKFQIASVDSNDDLEEFRKDIQEIAAQRCTETIQKAEEIAKSFIEEKCKIVIRNIVSEEISGQVMRTACSLAIRNSLQKTQRWIHVQIPGAFRQEIDSCLQKCSKIQTRKESPTKDESPTDTRLSDTQSTLSTPSVLLQELKDAIYQLLTTSDPDRLVSQHLSLIMKSKEVLKEKQLLPHLSVSAVESLLEDLIALTCIVSPNSIPLSVAPKEELALSAKKIESKTHEFISSPTSKSPASKCAIKSEASENPSNLQQPGDSTKTSQNKKQFRKYLQEFSEEPPLASTGNLSSLIMSQTRTDFLQEIISVSKSHFPDKLNRESFFSPRTDLLHATISNSAEAKKELQQIFDYFVELNIIQDEDL